MSDLPPRYAKNARIKARRSVVQAYYQWLITRSPIDEIVKEFKSDRNELKKADIDYFEYLLVGMVDKCNELDKSLSPLLDRADGELDPVESAILHLGAYELLNQREIPCRVVINESVELAKMFGAEQSHKYINGVLDKLGHLCRKDEFKNSKKQTNI